MYKLKQTIFIILSVYLVTAGFCFTIVMRSNVPIARASFLDVIRALVTINPLEAEITAPAEVMTDKVFRVQANIINKGEEKINNSRAEIFLPPGLVLVSKNKEQKAGMIPAQKNKRAQWRIKGEETGNYVILVSAKGELRGYEVRAEASAIIIIIEEADIKNADKEGSDAPSNFRSLWQNLLNFFSKLVEI